MMLGSLSKQNQVVVLVDNGSLKAEPIIQLRRLAAKLQDALKSNGNGNDANLKVRVYGCSARHSNRIATSELIGIEHPEIPLLLKDLLEHIIKQHESELENRNFGIYVVPFFLGPSNTVTEFISQTISDVKDRYSSLDFDLKLLPTLADIPSIPDDNLNPYIMDDNTIHGILVKNIFDVVRETQLDLNSVPILLVDHGTPSRSVNDIRRKLAALVRMKLHVTLKTNETNCRARVLDCSMENPLERSLSADELGDTVKNFNYPTLKQVFTEPSFGINIPKNTPAMVHVVICYLFLAPGRHAGVGGDIDQILTEVQQKIDPSVILKIHKTQLIASPANEIQLVPLLINFLSTFSK